MIRISPELCLVILVLVYFLHTSVYNNLITT